MVFIQILYRHPWNPIPFFFCTRGKCAHKREQTFRFCNELRDLNVRSVVCCLSLCFRFVIKCKRLNLIQFDFHNDNAVSSESDCFKLKAINDLCVPSSPIDEFKITCFVVAVFFLVSMDSLHSIFKDFNRRRRKNTKN